MRAFVACGMRPPRMPAKCPAGASKTVSPLRLASALLLIAAALAGCKTLPLAPAPSPSEPWEVRRAALQARDKFDLTGRIAVAAAQDGFNAKLRWQQQGRQSQLALDGPLGVPDPAHPADEMLDDTRRLATLKQDGWQIDYTSYADVRGQALPLKVTLKRENVRVRLVVDGWGS